MKHIFLVNTKKLPSQALQQLAKSGCIEKDGYGWGKWIVRMELVSKAEKKQAKKDRLVFKAKSNSLTEIYLYEASAKKEAVLLGEISLSNNQKDIEIPVFTFALNAWQFAKQIALLSQKENEYLDGLSVTGSSEKETGILSLKKVLAFLDTYQPSSLEKRQQNNDNALAEEETQKPSGTLRNR